MDDQHPDADETSRLLSEPLVPVSLTKSPRNTRTRRTPDPWRTIISVAAFVLILAFSSDIALVPQTAILQDIICRDYYAQHTTAHTGHISPIIPVDGCLIEPVQSEVAYINGWKDSLEIVPAMLLAVPYGALADRLGRKQVLLLAIGGCFLTDIWTRVVYWFSDLLPVRLVWLGGLAQAIGAGSATLSSVSLLFVADVAPVDQRTIAFSYILSATMVSKVIFYPIGGALAEINPWLAMLISSIFMFLSFWIVVVFVPETLPSAITSTESAVEEQLVLIPTEDNDCAKSKISLQIREQLASLAEAGEWMARNIRVGMLIFCFFLVLLGEQAFSTLLLQYTEKRLGWSLGKASYILSLGAGVNLLNLVLILPLTSAFLVKRLGLHEITKDKLIAQASGILLVLGSVTLFFARSWILLATGQVLSHLGYAFTIPARSIVTGMVEQKHFGSLYTGISVLTYAGVVASGPLFAGIFKLGMQLGNPWTGMPFLVVGGCFTAALLVLSAATAKTQSRDCADDEEGRSLSEAGIAPDSV